MAESSEQAKIEMDMDRTKLAIDARSSEGDDRLNYRIHYVLTMPKQDLRQISPYFGFTPGVLDSLNHAFELLRLPRHPLFFQLQSDQKRAWAMGGGTYQILPSDVDGLWVFRKLINFRAPVWCFISTEETANAVTEFVKTIEHPILHLCAMQSAENGISLWKCAEDDVFDYCKRVVRYLKGIGSPVPQIIEEILDLPALKEPPQSVDVAEREHYVIHGNETVLRTSNYSLAPHQQLCGTSNDPYIRAICDSTSAITKEQYRVESNGLRNPPTFSLLLCCASFYKHVYGAKPGHEVNEIIRRIFNSYRKQTKYFAEVDEQTLEALKTPAFQGMVGVYRSEIDAFSKAVAVKAANNFAPVIRLPPILNHIQEEVDNLARCARGNNPHLLFKQEKLFSKISESLSKGTPSEFYQFIDVPHNRIKLVGNVPLEWLDVRGLPLMIRYETSRIPSTPGNVMFDQCVVSREVGMSASAFRDVLVIRSYEPNDPVRDVLETALKTVRPSEGNQCRFIIKDVSTVDEFIAAINSFEGVVMIFDGHGSASISDVGKILIGSKAVDLYEFRTVLRVPSIIILSSCDTHAVDGAHASVGNTFLMLGAMTVLATLLPVNANEAAVFAGRLFLRIAELLPKMKREIRWSTFLSGMQKQVYVTEQVRRLYQNLGRKLSFQSHQQIQTQANHLILTADPDWYEKSTGMIAKEIDAPVETTRIELKRACQLVDIIKYIQLGNPEQILIVPEN
jgi:hypothetical protein